MKTAMRPWTMSCASALVVLMIGAGSASAAQTHDLTMTGSGMVTTEPTEDCEISEDGCAMDMSGSLIGQSVGNSDFDATVTTYWQGALDMGTASSQCAPATGALTVTAANSATVSVVLNGFTCDIPLDGGDSALNFDGSFYVIDSTGNLSGLTGTGRLTLGVEPPSDVTLMLHGAF